MTKNVVVTGIGMLTCNGLSRTEVWDSIVSGRSGIGTISRFDPSEYTTQIAGEIKDYEPTDSIDKKTAKRLDRVSQLGLTAAIEALSDSGLEVTDELADEVGVIVGTGIGGMETFEEQHQKLLEKGPRRISPFFIPMMIPNIPSGQIGIYLGLRGPNFSAVSACATGGTCLGLAADQIVSGRAKVMLAGGCESSITPMSIGGFCAMKAMSVNNDNPKEASRPFDLKRDGFVMGEGSAVLVLEEEEHARRRGARIYGRFLSYGVTGDAYHMTAPDPEGKGALRAMQQALSQARLASEQVQYVNAHGTSTPLGDPCEVKALHSLFGSQLENVPVSSTKSMTGHTLGAAGAIETALTILSLYHGVIPPTINYEFPDPECDIDVVPNIAREQKNRYALNNTFGFGGQNTVVLLGAYE